MSFDVIVGMEDAPQVCFGPPSNDPADTVDWNSNGLRMATTSCPARSDADSPNWAIGSPVPSTRITARSVAGSSGAGAPAAGRWL